MDTPLWNLKNTEEVYEPAEDSFLLLDALEADLSVIRDKKPTVVLEVGSGSGIIITALAKALNNTAHCMAIDINKQACQTTQETADLNSAQVEVINGDLLTVLKSGTLVDLLIFNPPYVVTNDLEISGTLPRAWAGGSKGRVVIDRFLDQLCCVLSQQALLYLVVIKENIPEEITSILQRNGWNGGVVAFRKIRGEQLSILRFSKQNLFTVQNVL